MARAQLIAVTGHGRDEDRIRAPESGFDYELTKPAEPAVLLELLEGEMSPMASKGNWAEKLKPHRHPMNRYWLDNRAGLEAVLRHAAREERRDE
jgi:DNA-binding response OmpR family regulator